MIKIATILGARPQFIKAAPVSLLFQGDMDFCEILIHTGQHYDANMSAIFFDQLGLSSPDVNLGIGSFSPPEQIAKMIAALESVLERNRPDWVLVYGDTNSTLAGAITAAKMGLPLAHIEAGLRSFNKKMPEELNRLLTDHCSNLLFTPTQIATENLRAENVEYEAIHQVGDVMYDAAILFSHRIPQQPNFLEQLGLESRRFILTTIHRAENVDDPERLKEIWLGLNKVAERVPVAMPIHPRTRKLLMQQGLLDSKHGRLVLMNPVGYLEMTALIRNAKFVVTDSGGLQKEAFFHRVFCLTLRNETEWVELLDSGWNELITARTASEIAEWILLELKKARSPSVIDGLDLYGSGDAAKKIISILKVSKR